MSVKLPRDAEGREIPLDTVVLFNARGDAFNIVRWIYTTDFETWSESNTWRAIEESHRAFNPEAMYLTPPDSWEKLEDDLDRALSTPSHDTYASIACGYFDSANVNCAVCERKHGIRSETCTDDAWRNIVSRIRKLRGAD